MNAQVVLCLHEKVPVCLSLCPEYMYHHLCPKYSDSATPNRSYNKSEVFVFERCSIALISTEITEQDKQNHFHIWSL